MYKKKNNKENITALKNLVSENVTTKHTKSYRQNL